MKTFRKMMCFVVSTVGLLLAGGCSDELALLKQSAELGNVEAQNTLAEHYYTGVGVVKNPAEAVKWWRKAADQGHAQAQYNLGVCYNTGVGVPENPTEAVKWWQKAAERGDMRARSNLGAFYLVGRGVEKDVALGIKWIEKAAEQGDSQAQQLLKTLVTKDDTQEVNNTQQQDEDTLAVDQQTGFPLKILAESAAKGNSAASVRLAQIYLERKDFVNAQKWAQKASEQGYPSYAQEMLETIKNKREEDKSQPVAKEYSFDEKIMAAKFLVEIGPNEPIVDGKPVTVGKGNQLLWGGKPVLVDGKPVLVKIRR